MSCSLPDLLLGRASGLVDLQQLRDGQQHAAREAAGPAPSSAAAASTAALLARRSPLVAGADFFAPPADRRRGAAASAAAAAAAAALRQHARDEPALATPAVDVPAALLAGLPPPRLGQIVAPEPLPYDLRAAQQVRALAAAHAQGGSGGGRAAVELCAAGGPALPPVACPLAVAAQCGELGRLLEVMEEEAAAEEGAGQQRSGGGSPAARPPAARRLVLPGVAPEEHAALCQLVACLAGTTHAGRLEATLLLDVTRLADLLDAPALLGECLAVLACMHPGPETFAPLLALAEARQHHPALQRLQCFYRHALTLHILEGAEPLLRWALHGLQAGASTVLAVCTEVAHEWLPLQPSLYLGSPAGDLAALSSPEWQAAAGREPARVRALLLAALPLLQRQLEAAEQADGGGAAANKRRLGPFQQAAAKARPRPGALRSLSDAALAAEAQRVLQRLQRALPRQRAAERGQVTAAVFRQAEVRARRQRRRGEQGGC